MFMLLCASLAQPRALRAQDEMTWEYCVQVSSQIISTSPPSLLFSWPQDMATLPDYYTVSRKYTTDTNWGPALLLPGTTTNYLDTNIVVGVPYEYQF